MFKSFVAHFVKHQIWSSASRVGQSMAVASEGRRGKCDTTADAKHYHLKSDQQLRTDIAKTISARWRMAKAMFETEGERTDGVRTAGTVMLGVPGRI